MAYLHTTIKCTVVEIYTKFKREAEIHILQDKLGSHPRVIIAGENIGYIKRSKTRCIGCKIGTYRIVAGTITHINEKTIEDWKNGLRVR